MKMVLIAFVLLNGSLLAREASLYISNSVHKNHLKFIEQNFHKGIEKYNKQKRQRKKLINLFEKNQVNKRNIKLFNYYLKKHPRFRPANARLIGEEIIMIHKNNKIRMKISDYMENTFYLNNQKFTFDLDNDLSFELSKLKKSYRQKGIPLLIYLPSLFMNHAYAQESEHFQIIGGAHFEIGLSFYSLLISLRSSAGDSISSYLSALNSKLEEINNQCEESTQDTDSQQQFLENVNAYTLGDDELTEAIRDIESHSSGPMFKIPHDDCPSQIYGLFRNYLNFGNEDQWRAYYSKISTDNSFNERKQEQVERICKNILIVDNCIKDKTGRAVNKGSRNPAGEFSGELNYDQDFTGSMGEGR
jgi:hypothetical protein